MTFEQRLGENKGGLGKMTSTVALRQECAWFFKEEQRGHYGHITMSKGEYYMERANGSQITQTFVGHRKGFGSYSEQNGAPLEALV